MIKEAISDHRKHDQIAIYLRANGYVIGPGGHLIVMIHILRAISRCAKGGEESILASQRKISDKMGIEEQVLGCPAGSECRRCKKVP